VYSVTKHHKLELHRHMTEKLDPQTPLYRIVSFFELYGLIIEQKYRWALQDTFKDENEALGVVLQEQDHIVSRNRQTTEDGLARELEITRHNDYVSCWTLKPESIAMWSLYSPNSECIRIKSTLGKLRAAAELVAKEYDPLLDSNPPGSRNPVIHLSMTDRLEYVDFDELKTQIHNRYLNFIKRLKEAFANDPNYYNRRDGWNKDWAEFWQKPVIKSNSRYLKDDAYQHENEVRAILVAGVRNSVTIEELRASKDPMLSLYDRAEPGELDKYIFSKPPPNFIDEICFDPRMDKFKKDTFKRILGDSCPPIAESRAFGSLIKLGDYVARTRDEIWDELSKTID